ncbi:MAG: MBOAT family O-acyltransferase [Lachnospiraceae bacterium]
MLFNSYIFIFLFLPMILLGWFFLNKINQDKLSNVYLFVMSLWFYAYFNTNYLFIILISCIINFIISKSMDIFSNKRMIGFIGVAFNLGILFYFKYYDFFIENMNVLFNESFALKHIVLPLGISFFTFQQISYIIDRSKSLAPHYSFLEYGMFVTFFPQLVAGPIVLHSELIPQFRDKEKRKFDTRNFTDGCAQFIIGLSKKVLLADTLGLVVNNAYHARYYFTTWSAVLFIVAFAFELYFDFSGYCDMALGIGKMFNFSIPRNFNSPYKANSIKDFWNRWHMTLYRFFLTYVYIPLGGGKKGKLYKIRNTIIVFLLSGFWHGASWTYVIWGGLNGLGVSIEQVIKKKEKKSFFHWLYTFSFVLFTFIFFRSESVEDAFIIIKGLFNPFGFKFAIDMAQYMKIPELYFIEQVLKIIAPTMIRGFYFIAFLVILLISSIIIKGRNIEEILKERINTNKFAILLGILFTWSVISLSGVSTFLYFDF